MYYQCIKSSNASQLRAAYDTILELSSRPCAEPFLEPVPADLPSYYFVVRCPMDLATLRANLEAGKYVSAKQVWWDLCQIWYNCR